MAEPKTCEVCGRSDDTVMLRFCVFQQEIYDVNITETVCDACEHEHAMDI